MPRTGAMSELQAAIAARMGAPPRRGRQGARPMSEKHITLAGFTTDHQDERLTDRWHRWNAEYPQWAYERLTNFGWDSREAVRRVARKEAEKAEQLIAIARSLTPEARDVLLDLLETLRDTAERAG